MSIINSLQRKAWYKQACMSEKVAGIMSCRDKGGVPGGRFLRRSCAQLLNATKSAMTKFMSSALFGCASSSVARCWS